MILLTDSVVRRRVARGLVALWWLGRAAAADLLSYEVTVTEREVQAALDRAPAERQWLDGRLRATLQGHPVLALGRPPGRIGVVAVLQVGIEGAAPVPVDLQASAGLRYDPAGKAFYLTDTRVESLNSPALPRWLEPAARKLATQMLQHRLTEQPVYVLRDDAGLPERVVRGWLRAVRVEPGRILATLSPF